MAAPSRTTKMVRTRPAKVTRTRRSCEDETPYAHAWRRRDGWTIGVSEANDDLHIHLGRCPGDLAPASVHVCCDRVLASGIGSDRSILRTSSRLKLSTHHVLTVSATRGRHSPQLQVHSRCHSAQVDSQSHTETQPAHVVSLPCVSLALYHGTHYTTPHGHGHGHGHGERGDAD